MREIGNEGGVGNGIGGRQTERQRNANEKNPVMFICAMSERRCHRQLPKPVTTTVIIHNVKSRMKPFRLIDRFVLTQVSQCEYKCATDATGLRNNVDYMHYGCCSFRQCILDWLIPSEWIQHNERYK